MFSWFHGWTLQRSPLAPSVPLEGSDTVQGLQTLERLRAARLLNTSTDRNGARQNAQQTGQPAPNRRRRYQRYKGPFADQLSIDDLKKDPRPWKQFLGIREANNNTSWWTALQQSYSVAASLDLLCERIDENAAYFATNYLRMMLLILMLVLYLRPIAVFGALAIGASVTYNVKNALEQQRRAAAAAQPNAAPQAPQPSPLGAGLAAVTWLAIAYTRCIPIITLGLCIAFFWALMHASLRQAPSEARHRGRSPCSYTFGQILGRQPVPTGSEPRLVFRQLRHAAVNAFLGRLRVIKQWSTFYLLTAWDAIRRPFVPAMRSAPLATSWS